MDTTIELHVFIDISKIVYRVACYIRSKAKNQPKCSFLTSKFKLALVNKKSKLIPQTELQFTMIASRLKL